MSKDQKLKIGIVGTGHLGKIHIKCLKELDGIYHIAGFFDTNPQVRKEVIEQFGIRAFSSTEELLQYSDVIDIVTPTPSHFEIASSAIEAGKHVFIEKPVTIRLSDAEKLKPLVESHGVKFQVGHVERYNPAFLAIKNMPLTPMFIEGHRLAVFNPRGTDVSVVLDLMIHDLDLICHLVKSRLRDVHASGVSVISATPDICNARLEFENGCVVNLTASRISLKQMRKLRMFQKDAYISLDFLEKESQIIKLFDTEPEHIDQAFEIELQGSSKWMQIENPEIQPVNAIKMELESFNNAILQDTIPDVTINDAILSLSIAEKILQKINNNDIRVA
jgi:predicted dehydrogenase